MFLIINKPYPFNRSKKVYLSIFAISCFVVAFLYAFQPWGMNNWQNPHKNLILAGYGLVIFVISSLFRFTLEFFISEDKWTVWKEIVSILVNVSLVAISIFFYGVVFNLMNFDLISMAYTVVAVFLLAVFPITLATFLSYNKYLVYNQMNANSMNKQIEDNKKDIEQDLINQDEITFIADNEKDTYKFRTDNLLFIESADNYAKIVCYENDKIVKTMIRSNLKRLESQHKTTFLLRCHRSFIVNLKQITHIEGNAQGYKINLFHCDDIIPVSRTYGSGILENLKNMKNQL